MSIHQVTTYYASCDEHGCTDALGKNENLSEWELEDQLENEHWEIDGDIFDGRTYCSKHSE